MTKKSLSPASYTQPGVLIDFDNGLGKIDPWATLRDMNPGKVYLSDAEYSEMVEALRKELV